MPIPEVLPALPHLAMVGIPALVETGSVWRRSVAALTRLVIDTAVGQVFAVDAGKLQTTTRGRKGVAQARQVAMYLAHVGLGCSLTQVGRVFGRDRTTVAHACAVIEDRRDEPGFDLALQCLESVVRHQLEARGILASRHLVGIEAQF